MNQVKMYILISSAGGCNTSEFDNIPFVKNIFVDTVKSCIERHGGECERLYIQFFDDEDNEIKYYDWDGGYMSRDDYFWHDGWPDIESDLNEIKKNKRLNE